MNTLFFDTSTEITYIAVRSVHGVSHNVTLSKASHSCDLFSTIEKTLSDCKIGIRDIQQIGVGIGPGSFTGIRIALSSARMLAQTLNVPLIGIHSQLVFACIKESLDSIPILVAFDAKKGRVYGAIYRFENGKPFTIAAPADYEPLELADLLPPTSLVYAAGDGAVKYGEQLRQILGNITILENTRILPDMILNITEYMFSANEGKIPGYQNVLPCYARKSDAEVLLEKKNNQLNAL